MRRSEIEREQAELAFLKLAYFRRQGLSEEEIADECGFASPQTLYQQLKNWEYPDWLIEAERTEDGNQLSGRSGERNKTRKARSGYGEGHELPDVANAVPVFEKDIELLRVALIGLHGLKEEFHRGRFLSYSWIEDDSEHYHKSMFSEQQWIALCKKWGVDPSAEEFYLSLAPHAYASGAGDTPDRDLTLLIGVHALMYGSVDRLTEALHPTPSSVDRKELYGQKKKDGAKQDGYVTVLRTAAANLAKVVRGGTVRRGARSGYVPPYEQSLAWDWILPLAKEGYSDEEIYRKLKEEGPLDEEGRYALEHYTVEEVTRLRNLLSSTYSKNLRQ